MSRRVWLVAGVVVVALGLFALSPLGSGLLAGAGSLGSCCGSTQAGAGTSTALEQAALNAYRVGTGDQAVVQAKVIDYGCHVQADIYKDGQRVRSYVLRGGQWVETR